MKKITRQDCIRVYCDKCKGECFIITVIESTDGANYFHAQYCDDCLIDAVRTSYLT